MTRRSGLQVLVQLARLEEQRKLQDLGRAQAALGASQEQQRALEAALAKITLADRLGGGVLAAAELRSVSEQTSWMRTQLPIAAGAVSRAKATADRARHALAAATLRARGLADAAQRREREARRTLERRLTKRLEDRTQRPVGGDDEAH